VFPHPRSSATALLTLGLALGAVACASPAAAPGQPTAAPAVASPPARSEPSPGPAAAGAAAGPRKLRMAINLNVTAAPVLVAIEKGYFAEAGLELELVPMGGGAEMVAPLSTGEIDAAAGGISASLFNAFARGVDVKIVSDFSRMSRGHGFGAFLARHDVELPTLASIRGKRVGFNNPGSPCHYMVGKMLEANGLTIADVETVYLPFNTLPGAFAKREIDAACAAEPWVANTLRAGDARLVLTYDELLPDMQVSVIMISNQLAAERAVAERFLAAFLRAAPEGKEKLPSTLEAVSRHTGLEVSVLRETIWTDVDDGGRVNVESIKDQLDFFTRAGLIQGTVEIDRIVDLSYLPRR